MVSEVSAIEVDDVEREHLLLVNFDMKAKYADWTVAPPRANTTRSGAQAMALDSHGRILLAGYVCADVCKPAGELRIYESDGTLAWYASLGAFPSKTLTGRDIAWSPAGYAVVALGEKQGQSYVFKVQAFAPGDLGPLWTFIPNDKQGLQIAFAVAVGPCGEVYAGGIGATNHAAFAVIGG